MQFHLAGRGAISQRADVSRRGFQVLKRPCRGCACIVSRVMTAISDGCYHLAGIPDPQLGPRHVEVETMYNTQRYRPVYDHKLGLPIFLTRAVE